MNRIRLLVVVACAVSIILATSQVAAASTDTTLMARAVAAAMRQPPALHALRQTQVPLHARSGPHRGPSKRKAVLIGAAIGGGIGALWGSHYCAADCGGGRPRGATVFGSLGAGIGAAGGLGVAILAGL